MQFEFVGELLETQCFPIASQEHHRQRLPRLRFVVVAFAAILSVTAARAQTKLDPKEPGTETIKVECGDYNGTIIGRSGVGYYAGEGEKQEHYSGGISIAYKGTKCADCHIIQFFWRALYWLDDKSKPSPVPAKGSGTGGSGGLTTDPAKPDWTVDHGGTTPYYDDADSTYIRDSDSLTELDAPSAAVPLGKVLKDYPKAASARYEAHYEAFLVCAGKVCAKVTWTVTQDYPRNAAGAQPPSRKITGVESPAKNPDAAQMKVLGDIPVPTGGQPWIK